MDTILRKMPNARGTRWAVMTYVESTALTRCYSLFDEEAF